MVDFPSPLLPVKTHTPWTASTVFMEAAVFRRGMVPVRLGSDALSMIQ